MIVVGSGQTMVALIGSWQIGVATGALSSFSVGDHASSVLWSMSSHIGLEGTYIKPLSVPVSKHLL